MPDWGWLLLAAVTTAAAYRIARRLPELRTKRRRTRMIRDAKKAIQEARKLIGE